MSPVLVKFIILIQVSGRNRLSLETAALRNRTEGPSPAPCRACLTPALSVVRTAFSWPPQGFHSHVEFDRTTPLIVIERERTMTGLQAG